MISVWRIEGRHTQKRQILKPTRCDISDPNNVDLWNSKMLNHPTHIISKSWPELQYICIDIHKQDTTGWSIGRCTNNQVIRTWVAQCMFDTIQFYLLLFYIGYFLYFTWIFIFFLYLILWKWEKSWYLHVLYTLCFLICFVWLNAFSSSHITLLYKNSACVCQCPHHIDLCYQWYREGNRSIM